MYLLNVIGILPRRGRARAMGLIQRHDASFAVSSRRVLAAGVDEASRCHAQQPAAGLLRDAPCRPLASGLDQGLLHGVLTGGELPVSPDERSEDVWCLTAPHVLAVRGSHASLSPPGHMTGRSSMVSPGPANFAAISSARLDDSTSIRKNPARCSLLSA